MKRKLNLVVVVHEFQFPMEFETLNSEDVGHLANDIEQMIIKKAQEQLATSRNYSVAFPRLGEQLAADNNTGD